MFRCWRTLRDTLTVWLAVGWSAWSLGPGIAGAQSINFPWSNHGHNAQHDGLTPVPSQPLNQIRWQTPVDLAPQYTGSGTLLAHYGSPLITRSNTVLLPVKTGPSDGFRIEARNGSNGTLKWTSATDYSLPSSSWVPTCGLALTPKNRLYFPGAGGTVYFRDDPDAATGATGQIAFYGLTNYLADTNAFNAAVRINTPITADRYGNIFFGFIVNGATTPALQSGIARISVDGAGSWVAATNAASDASVSRVVFNCAPALSLDHRTLYVAVSYGNFQPGYLVSLDSRTLAPIARVRLRDAANPVQDALMGDIGTASPTVGPDGDVYFGVLEGSFWANHFRGWLLHFNQSLTQTNLPGAFGWDDSASIVPSALVPSYSGPSKYLVLVKYNNYVGGGGDGVNKMAILDPNVSMVDPISGATVMKEVLTIAGPTPDDEYPNMPGAVREWCVNTVAVDPFTKSAIVHSEDGKVYRWDFATNTLIQPLTVTVGIGQAYTPTVVGVDGTVYIIANAILFAIGQ